MANFDVIIVGGGAVGVSVARTLVGEGVRGVALLERAHLAAGFTSRAAGIVSALTWDPTDARLVTRSAEIYRQVAADHPGRFRFLEGGMLTLVGDRAAAAAMDRRAAMLREVGVRVERLHPEEAAARWPDLRLDGVVAAWFTPDDGHVYAYDYTTVVGEEIAARGVRIVRDTAAARVAIEGGRAAGVETAGGERLAADVVVAANGVWSRKLLRASGLDLPLKPYRTQVAVLEAPEAPRVPILHDTSLEFYWIPDGRKIIFGDGTEERESDPDAFFDANDEDFLLSVAERLPRRCAGGASARLTGGWAGLCDATPDRRPLLGPYGGVEGLHLAVGFNGFGVMRAPAVGEAVARLVLGRPAGLDLATHLARRFSGFVDFPITQGFSTVE
ncbi:MAG: FAD-binding oxidoreductase [Firmicutes bacterium]|nr:FAD-binding oxidoreductase [Bacillota bacterium]